MAQQKFRMKRCKNFSDFFPTFRSNCTEVGIADINHTPPSQVFLILCYRKLLLNTFEFRVYDSTKNNTNDSRVDDKIMCLLFEKISLIVRQLAFLREFTSKCEKNEVFFNIYLISRNL